MASAEPGISEDRLFGGQVVFHQPARGEGYRANVDALLLAAFALRPGRAPSQHACDLGSGAGAVSLALLHLGAVRRALLVETDPLAARCAAENLQGNGWAARADVAALDVHAAAQQHAGEFDLVISNPPYTSPTRGQPPPEPSRARARSGSLERFVDAARLACGKRARVCFVYPAHELTTLMHVFRSADLEPKRLRFVHPYLDAPARIVLVEAVHGKTGGLAIEAPLTERKGDEPSVEIASLLLSSRAAPLLER